MVSGNIGSQNLKRPDYTAIGDNVDTLDRLQDAAQPGQIMISEACYDRMKALFKFENISHITVKNNSNSLTTFKVIA